MSDTPRTEVEVNRAPCLTDIVTVSADFACQLERELTAAKERIRRLEEAAREVYLDSIASDHEWTKAEANHMNALREVLEAKL